MDKLGQALALIAERLGTTVDRLWPQLVAVTFWTSIAWMVVDSLILAAFAVASVKVVRLCVGQIVKEKARTSREYSGGIADPGWYMAIGGVVTADLLAFLAVVTSFPSLIAGVIAPEGMTVIWLLKDVAGK